MGNNLTTQGLRKPTSTIEKIVERMLSGDYDGKPVDSNTRMSKIEEYLLYISEHGFALDVLKGKTDTEIVQIIQNAITNKVINVGISPADINTSVNTYLTANPPSVADGAITPVKLDRTYATMVTGISTSTSLEIADSENGKPINVQIKGNTNGSTDVDLSFNLVVSNSNLFTSVMEYGDIDSTTGIAGTSTQGYWQRTKDYIPVESSTKYQLSWGDKRRVAEYVYYYTKNNTFISRQLIQVSYYTGTLCHNIFTTPSNCAYIKFLFVDEGTMSNIYDLMLEKRTTLYNYTYTASINKNIIITLSDALRSTSTLYDYISKVNGTWGITRVLDSNYVALATPTFTALDSATQTALNGVNFNEQYNIIYTNSTQKPILSTTYNRKLSSVVDSINTNINTNSTNITNLSTKVDDDYKVTFYTLSNYYAVVGKEMNWYYDNIMAFKRPSDIYITATCPTLGIKQLDDCIRVTPTSDKIGTHVVTINIYKLYINTSIQSTTFNINVVANSSLINPAKAIFLGDSLTENNNIQNVIKDDFGSNFTLYGTRGTAPYKHEGRWGWSINDYLTNATVGSITNPFYNSSLGTASKFDFSYYITNNPTFSDVNVVNIFLGRNDSYWNDTIITNLETMISSIHAYNSNIKVVLMTPYHTCKTGYSLGMLSVNTNDFRASTFYQLNRFYTKFANREGENIFIFPTHINLDTYNDYDRVATQISARNINTFLADTGTVHPNTYGGAKFADVWYSWYQAKINK